MEWCCGLLFVAAVAVVGYLIGRAAPTSPPRPFRYCPACGAEADESDFDCRSCGLNLESRLAYELNRVRVAEREVRALLDAARLDRDTSEAVLKQLEFAREVCKGCRWNGRGRARSPSPSNPRFPLRLRHLSRPPTRWN